MEQNLIHKYLRYENPFSEEDIHLIEKMLDNNSWFSIGNQLLLKAYKQNKNVEYYNILSKVAIQTYNREQLYHYLQKEIEEPNFTVEIDIEGSIELVPEQETTTLQNESLFSFSNEYFSLESVDILPRQKEESPNDLVSKFIQTNPRIVPRPLDFKSSDEFHLDEDYEVNNNIDDLVSESLAEIYISQGLMNHAIECYNKLSLLNPEKSAYFAKLIESIKNK